MLKKTRLSLLIIMALTLGALLLVPASAFASQVATNKITFVHAIPGVPVDLYISRKLAVNNIQPLTVTPLDNIGEDKQFTIYKAGDTPAAFGINAVASQTPLYRGGSTFSVVAHLRQDGRPIITSFRENQTFSPGFGRLAIRHVAELGPVDVYIKSADGSLVATKFGLTNAQPFDALSFENVLPVGEYSVAITPAGQSPDAAPLKGTFVVKDQSRLDVYAVGNPADGTLGVLTETLDR